ncbi:hypothetical protein BCR39DRAFT_543502 [Naematelia encephala]|uniref:chitin deacetylase n=1 Tax=Naematelia encephala TaxID=71784 RepID=A0A1Y2ATT0_9TREE|nr:hypothetical protein BCR39DRAFT_543502 [Naematelia encephala]
MVHFAAFPAVMALVAGHTLAAPLGDWYQAADSSVAAMFHKRYTPSPSDANFTSNYPTGWTTPTSDTLPKAWTDKLASIQMPNVSVATQNNGYPTYPNGESGADSTICSFTYECTTSDDLLNPPDGVLALTFDDGPTDYSEELYAFLSQNNASGKATHFMIGGNILGSPTVMQDALKAGGHIAVHTWSHPYMTTLTNEQVLGELGWTMQIISDLSGGRVPKFWRPPYGDVDNRVRAIAKGVFGLETVPWNQDSADWAIGTDAQYTNASVEASINQWLSGSKTPGLCMLEHELNANTVGVFENVYPNMVSNGWNVKTVADAWSLDWYQNAADDTATVTSMAIAGDAVAQSSTASSSSAVSSTSASSKTTSTAASVSASSTSAVTSTTASSAQSSANASSAAAVTSKTGAAGRVQVGAGWAVVLFGAVVGVLSI